MKSVGGRTQRGRDVFQTIREGGMMSDDEAYWLGPDNLSLTERKDPSTNSVEKKCKFCGTDGPHTFLYCMQMEKTLLEDIVAEACGEDLSHQEEGVAPLRCEGVQGGSSGLAGGTGPHVGDQPMVGKGVPAVDRACRGTPCQEDGQDWLNTQIWWKDNSHGPEVCGKGPVVGEALPTVRGVVEDSGGVADQVFYDGGV